jgi:uncharacterized protein YcfL
LAEIQAKNGQTQPIKDIKAAKTANAEQNNIQLSGSFQYTIDRIEEVSAGKKFRVYIQVYCVA